MRHTNILQTMLLPIQPELRWWRVVILIEHVKPFEASLLLEDLERLILGSAREHPTLGFIIGRAVVPSLGESSSLVQHPMVRTGWSAHQSVSSVSYKGA
jgi:hypothetical protein